MTKRTLRETVAAAVLALVVGAPTLLVNARAQGAQNGSNGFPDLVGGLKATPGVLGVETARTSSGKMVIFAWFENKKAALAWYYSDAHQALMRQFSGSNRRPSGPMPDVPDDGRPILAVASLTMPSVPPAGGDLRAAVTQIAIELYAPLPGGIAAGGRFAPSTVKVPGMIEVPLTARSSADGR
jgi:hypothetical protein